MSDGTFNRLQRQFEARGQDSRGQDSRGQDSRGQDFRAPDQGADRRPATDPLLELARLIGQSDPFAPVPARGGDAHGADSRDGAAADRAPFIRPLSRDPAQPQDRSDRPLQALQDRPLQALQDRPLQAPQERRLQTLQALQARPERYEPDFGRQDTHQDTHHQDAHYQDPQYQDPHYDAQPAPPPRFPIQPAQPAPAPSGGHYAPDNSVFARLSGQDQYPVAPRQAPADGAGHDDHADSQGYAQAHADADSQAPQADPAYSEYPEGGEYAEGEYEPDADYEYDADSEEEHPVSLKRRNTTKIVIAVLALAVFGSAAAFGYRTVFKGGAAGPTPIIRADTSPTKVMPVASDAAGMKPINERLGDGSGERLVRRDEDPADLRIPSRTAAAGVVGPAGPLAGSGVPPATVPASGQAAAGPVSLTEPKRVHTVTIRADQGAPPDRAAPPAARAPTQRQAAAVPTSPAAPPMAITPDAPPARIPPSPAAPRANEGGGWVVQLSAQKSEAEAQAAFRSAQTKYAALSSRAPLIRRKDTERGVFYAAQVGPFGSKGDADQMCQSLKSVGGDCFVQRN
jgi:hypothetical protein